MTKTFNAYAKLNLLLDVTSKRPDGYHDIATVMQTVDLHDEINITVVPSETPSIALTCENSADCPGIKWDSTNLVYKAAECALKHAKAPVSVTMSVRKDIPDGAGMGGGSADAAAVLNGLNEMLGLGLSLNELLPLGESLGADVPFCILGGTALCEGKGEILTPLPAPKAYPCVILKPPVSLSTKDIYILTDKYLEDTDNYGSLHPDPKAFVSALNSPDPSATLKTFGNFMEYAALEICPGIGELKDILIRSGAIVSQMTGSGSAVFGIYEDAEAAKKAFDGIDPSKAKKFISFFRCP